MYNIPYFGQPITQTQINNGGGFNSQNLMLDNNIMMKTAFQPVFGLTPPSPFPAGLGGLPGSPLSGGLGTGLESLYRPPAPPKKAPDSKLFLFLFLFLFKALGLFDSQRNRRPNTTDVAPPPRATNTNRRQLPPPPPPPRLNNE